jgi:hypothetical protein
MFESTRPNDHKIRKILRKYGLKNITKEIGWDSGFSDQKRRYVTYNFDCISNGKRRKGENG